MNHPIVLLYVDINKNLAICHHHFNLTHKFVFRSENGNYNLAKSTILWANLSSLVKNRHFILTLMILMKKRMKTKRLNDFQNQKIKKHSKKRFKSLEFSDPFHKNSFVILAAKSVFYYRVIFKWLLISRSQGTESSKYKQSFWKKFA